MRQYRTGPNGHRWLGVCVVSDDELAYTHYPGYPDDMRVGHEGLFHLGESLQVLLDGGFWVPVYDPDLVMDIGL